MPREEDRGEPHTAVKGSGRRGAGASYPAGKLDELLEKIATAVPYEKPRDQPDVLRQRTERAAAVCLGEKQTLLERSVARDRRYRIGVAKALVQTGR